MLETIREFAREQLETADGHEEVQRHLMAYLLTVTREPTHAVEADWMRHGSGEMRNNIRAAIQWALTGRQVDLALQLQRNVGWFWASHGYFTEAREWYTTTLELDDGRDPALRADVLDRLSWIAAHQGDYEHSTQAHQESGVAQDGGEYRRDVDGSAWDR